MYDTLYAILNKSENATVQYFIFCEKVLDEKYLLKINNVFQTSSKRFVETPPMCLFWCLSYVPYCVWSFIQWVLQLRMRKKDCFAYQKSSYLCYIITQGNCFITWNKLRNQFRIYQICKKGKCLPLTKTNREYYINITFPDWVIVQRNVIITFPEMIFSTIT